MEGSVFRRRSFSSHVSTTVQVLTSNCCYDLRWSENTLEAVSSLDVLSEQGREWWVGAILNRPHLHSRKTSQLCDVARFKMMRHQGCTGKMAQPGKDSPSKPEDPSRNPSHYVKSQMWGWTLAIPMPGRRRPEDPWCSLASQSNQTGKPQHPVRTLSQKPKVECTWEGVTPGVVLWPLRGCTHNDEKPIKELHSAWICFYVSLVFLLYCLVNKQCTYRFAEINTDGAM